MACNSIYSFSGHKNFRQSFNLGVGYFNYYSILVLNKLQNQDLNKICVIFACIVGNVAISIYSAFAALKINTLLKNNNYINKKNNNSFVFLILSILSIFNLTFYKSLKPHLSPIVYTALSISTLVTIVLRLMVFKRE